MDYTQRYGQINHIHCKGIIKSSKIPSEVTQFWNKAHKSKKRSLNSENDLSTHHRNALRSPSPTSCKSISLAVSTRFLKSKCPWLLLESVKFTPLTLVLCCQAGLHIDAFVLQTPGSPQPFAAGQRGGGTHRSEDRSGGSLGTLKQQLATCRALPGAGVPSPPASVSPPRAGQRVPVPAAPAPSRGPAPRGTAPLAALRSEASARGTGGNSRSRCRASYAKKG